MIERIIQRLPRWARAPAEIVVKAGQEFGLDRSGRMAAAIAYRTIFALAPLLIIAVSVVGAVLGSSSQAQTQILDTISSVAGSEIAELLDTFVASALESANTAAIVGIAALFWTGSSLFLEVQQDLNDIFDARSERITGLLRVVWARGIGFLWVLGLGLILMAILALNAIWRFLGDLLPENMEPLHLLISYLSPLVSVLLLPLVFGLVFQTMTAVTVSWRAIRVGGIFTALTFVAAAYGIGVYFETFDTSTALGFTGSFVVVVFLANLLSTVFLFGAQVTKVYADRLGERPMARRTDGDTGDQQVVVAEPPRVPQAAIFAFVAGLFVAWRRNRR